MKMISTGSLYAAGGSSSFDDHPDLRRNLGVAELYEASLARGEAKLTKSGALLAETGRCTGRSPNDKFIVRDALTDPSVWWENARSLSPAQFDRLHADMAAHARSRPIFEQQLFAGADPTHRLSTRVFTEYAWHSLFIRNLLRRPEAAELRDFRSDLTILDLPSFAADPARHGVRSQTVIALDFTRRVVLICGSAYAGEIKKSVFTFLNFLLPTQGILPMHCAANLGRDNDAALFFGLSGTGKTTLSTDPDRVLIGDDEHGWGEDGVFNFEGGCYAKAIRLSRNAEPQIFAAANRFGSVMENVILDPHTRQVDFDDASLTENTRIAYPLDFIDNASPSGRCGHPSHIVMLACDAFGVLPPISRLDPAQAMYHFLSGYTAKVAGAEKGVREPQATFSACFGAPFMPRHPAEYGAMLKDFASRRKVDCWLVNTGWTGGGYGVGSRMPIAATRAMLKAALSGELAKGGFQADPYFGVEIPASVDGVDPALLDPSRNWSSRSAYESAARKLVAMFQENFSAFAPYVGADVLRAQPCERLAA